MKVLRWLSRVEYVLCAVGLTLLLSALIASFLADSFFVDSSVAARVMDGDHLQRDLADPYGPLAGLGLVLMGFFGMGPALAANPYTSVSAEKLTRRGLLSSQLAKTAAHAVTAFVFFVLFCIAAYTASETRALGDLVTDLGWPLWPLQALMVFAFGGNVVRYSIYAADASTRPAPDTALDTLHRQAAE